ncbi:cation:proton antiporter domain-containing protein [Klebsiella pneumoniae]|uniref:cation:proton antiporter domain-containing protein n=1 Tax=Klebsiella pneumoniae TaxID=573 RepID=UPI003D32979E
MWSLILNSLVLFIPPLLFADGWKNADSVNFSNMVERFRPRALALVVVTVVGIGFLIYWVVPGGLILAFALAAVLSPTDAVALPGLLAKGASRKNHGHFLQGEVLMNDASGLGVVEAAGSGDGDDDSTVGGATVEFWRK